MLNSQEIIRGVLKENYLELKVEHYMVSEAVGEGAPCKVEVTLNNATSDRREVIKGEGVGAIDAVSRGMLDHYAREFHSLETITFTDFRVRGNMETGHKHNTDAEALVTLSVHNSDQRKFEFEASGRSLIAAVIEVVVDAMEYFVNSERAFITVYKALCDARDRDRADLVQKYTAQLAGLVRTTSYTKVIERIKTEALAAH